MLQCPSCDTTLDQDFGMVTCKSCKAVLMIDISGHVQMGSETTPTPDEEFLVEPTNEAVFDKSGIYEQTQTPTENIDPDQTLPELPNAEEGLGEVVDNFTNTGEVFDPIQEDMDALSEEPVEESVSVQAEDLFEEEEEGEEDFSMPQEPDPKPVDITSFANSEVSSLEDGEYLYDVKVGRLDSKDLKEAFKYVLLDEKLKLNHHEFLKKIKDGKVVIPDLNPIKAKRIVEQLQYYDLDIKWLQKRVIMEVVEPESEEDEGDDLSGDAIV